MGNNERECPGWISLFFYIGLYALVNVLLENF